MRKINILTKSVYNRIAAGEVIDRPYSVVKELVENSIDAGATEIEIHIEKGGKQLIKVSDNGCGIERDDMRAAFFPHATSKISKAADINSVTTLGFRGEALASIAVISKTELISVTAGNPAYKVCAADDKISDVEPAALDCGTEVTVRDLFYNTPVRANFLNSDKKEETDITNFVTRFILGNPNISFRYYADGALVLNSSGGGLEEAIAQVYGAKVISQCIKISAEKDGIKISGFIGNRNFYKANKTYQSIFLNGRYITNNPIWVAISNAYSPYCMKRQYPFYVLNIEVPRDFVDINVHPNKADVRFADNHKVFGAVYSVISSVLDGTLKATDFIVNGVKIPEVKSTKDDNTKKVLTDEEIGLDRLFNEPEKISLKIPEVEHKDLYSPPKGNELTDTFYRKVNPITKQTTIFFSGDHLPPLHVSSDPAYADDTRVKFSDIGSVVEQIKIDIDKCQYKGNFFNTYLIFEFDDIAYLMDQHAAHERIIYDKLLAEINDKNRHEPVKMQVLMSSYLFGVNAQEKEFIEKNIRLIRNMGFDLKPFGVYSYRVDCVPLETRDLVLENFFNDMLAHIDELNEISSADLLREKIAQTACKHAVKGKKFLDEKEAKELFKQLKEHGTLRCPHGRPICISFAKKDLEKLFKRIVH